MTVRGAPTVEHAHAVHWYERDDVLLDRLVEHFAPTLRGGANALVIASAAHRTLLRTGLADIGVDAALLDERLTLLDAEECLNRFVVDGQLDTDAFETSIAGPVRAAVAGGQRLSAYGEMVAVLWQAGDVTGALELERLWNALQRDVPFTLLCGYPSELFIDPHSATAFAEMCALHSQVVGGAPMPADAEASRRFPYGAHGPRLARRFVAETLTTWNLRDLIDRCVLVTSELA
ncbi:MAG TPA: MEDS domain-containing protein, partial [Mycobacteriales bacterium]|nr:MEDS domain-containing protein [Mycobacteriales bacterium]